MNNFEFHIPTIIEFGRQVEKAAGRMAAAYGKRALILYGSSRIEKSGLLGSTVTALEDAGVSCETCGGISGNPCLSDAVNICETVRNRQIDFLLAVGGGSVIDMAKAVSVGSCSDKALWDFYEGREIPKRALPVGVILTMAATASEANCKSVLFNDRTGQKAVLADPHIFPRFALLNPELTFTVPAEQTAIGAMDIFAHAFERYFHLGQRGTLRTNLCAALMRTVLQELPKAQREPADYESRSQLMWAATMAHSDMIGTEGVYVCHGMSHIFTKEFDLPHGMALAILMPAWCKYMIMEHAEEIAEFSRLVWDVDGSGRSAEETAQEGIFRFQNYICDRGLPVTLREAGIVQFDSDVLAKEFLGNKKSVGENFVPLGRPDIRAIFELTRG